MRLSPFRILLLLAVLATAGIAASRAQSGAGLTPRDVVGRYQATTFDVIEDGHTTRLSCAGGHLTIDVTADFVAGGELFVPDTLGLPPTRVNLFGPYELAARTITFLPEADAVVKGVPWTWHPGGILTGEVTDGPRRYVIELQRQ